MLEKIISMFFVKKPIRKQTLTVIRNNVYKKESSMQVLEQTKIAQLDNLTNGAIHKVDFNNRGKIYSMLFSACNRR